jgi:hypothetical protein
MPTTDSTESTPDGYWAGMPLDLAMAWTGYFFDYPPRFPGASFMNLAFHAYQRGKPGGFLEWADRAREAEAIGFTPERYYMLQMSLGLTDKHWYPRHPANHASSGIGGRPEQPFVLDLWRRWPELVESGTTPRRATQVVLSDGDPLPRGVLIGLRDRELEITPARDGSIR